MPRIDLPGENWAELCEVEEVSGYDEDAVLVALTSAGLSLRALIAEGPSREAAAMVGGKALAARIVRTWSFEAAPSFDAIQHLPGQVRYALMWAAVPYLMPMVGVEADPKPSPPSESADTPPSTTNP